MNNVTILCKDNNRNAAYLSNGWVIDLSVFEQTGNAVQLAELKQTNQSGVYAIIGIQSKAVTGYFNANTRTPTYLSNGNNSNGIIVGSSNSLNINTPSNDLGIGGVATGTVTLDSILGNTNSNVNTTHTADMPKQTTIVESVEEVFEYIDGYKFLPIPTTYSDVVTEKISGTAAKWKIKVKQSEKEYIMGKAINPHDEVYNELNGAARKAIYDVYEAKDTSVLLFGPTSYAMAYMISDNSSSDITITSGEQYFGYYDSVEVIPDINMLKNNTDIIINNNLKLAVENKLIALAKQSTNLHNWLNLAGKQLNKIEKAALKPYVLDLMIDYLTTVENQLNFSSETNPFDFDSNYLLDLIMDNIDDIVLRNKYLNGFDLIYARLTNIDNLKNYDILMHDLPASDKHRVLRVGGVGEVIPLVISKSKELDIELEKLVNSDDSDIYKISDNTPNTLNLVKAIFTNTIKVDSKQPFDLNKYSTIGTDMFLLLVDSNVMKVIRTEDSLLIRKLI